MPPRIGLYRHELSHIRTLIDRPILIELLQQTLNLGSVFEQLFRVQLTELFRHGRLGGYDREV